MILNIEAGRLPYEECWNILDDPHTQRLAADLGLRKNGIETTVLPFLMEREPAAIGLAKDIVGRSLMIIDGENPPVVAGTPYDAVTINGWGYNPLIQAFEGASTTNEVLLPSNRENFRDISPNTTETTIIVDGKEKNVSQPYLFPGAYTLEEVVNKVGAELALWGIIAKKGNPENAPFLLPIPIKIGMYPGLSDPQGRPAYYYVSRAPYKGERNGVISTKDRDLKLEDLISDSILAGGIAKKLHDLFGLAHNQMVMGNYRTSPGIKSFVADLATLTPLDTTPVKLSQGRHGSKNPFFGRAYELYHIVTGSVMRFMMPEVPIPEQEEFMNRYVTGVLQCYFDIKDYSELDGLFSISAEDRIDMVAIIAKALQRAQTKGLFYPNPNIEKIKELTWSLIEMERQHVAGIIT